MRSIVTTLALACLFAGALSASEIKPLEEQEAIACVRQLEPLIKSVKLSEPLLAFVGRVKERHPTFSSLVLDDSPEAAALDLTLYKRPDECDKLLDELRDLSAGLPCLARLEMSQKKVLDVVSESADLEQVLYADLACSYI